MLEQSRRSLLPSSPSDLDALQSRASQQRERHKRTSRSRTLNWQQLAPTLDLSVRSITRLPARFLLHTVVALVLPLAVALSQLPTGPLFSVQQPSVGTESADFVAPIAPLSLGAAIEGDGPLEDDGDIPVPLSLVSRSEALAPVIIPATVSGERVFLRNGPGTNYDAVMRVSGGTQFQVIGYYGDWFQIRERAGKPVYWIAGELLDLPENAVYTLFEIQDTEIPAAPPPKVALVSEDGLALRDGPGTNYIAMDKLVAGVQLELIERYEDWFHVGIPGGRAGWVKAAFLSIAPGIAERVLTAETIPDPNPALVGHITDNGVNLRKGPDSKYDKVTTIDAGTQVDLIGKYKDWFKVRTSSGKTAWVFSDLLNVSAHVARRIPITKDFPALPSKPRRPNSSRPGASANLANIAASGDVASYAVQFVGSRYVWGGASPNRGFDCSGLTSYVYRQFGVHLPHSAAGQFSTRYGASVGSMENLAPGDLVFFVNTGGRRGISHVALYIGGGRIVHAMTPRYGVQVSGVYERYWVQHYYGAIRPYR